MMRICSAIGLAAIWFLPASTLNAADQKAVLEDSGMIVDAREMRDQSVRIWLFNPTMAFSASELDAANRDALVKLIIAASKEARSVTVAYDANAGALDRAEDVVVFPLCSIALDSQKLAFPQNCSIPTAMPMSPDAKLGLAVASAQSGRQAQAVSLANETLADGRLEPRRARLARLARATSEAGLAMHEDVWSAAADRHYKAALDDLRILVGKAPDDVDRRFELGSVLEELGDYAGAKDTYSAILKRWPGEDYRVTVRLAAIERRHGRYAEALAMLDGLAARMGAPSGMKFRYHRAWTLNLMRRHDEAIVEIGEGLKQQPDYAYAYVQRACAYASTGRLREALADIEQATAKYSAIPHQPDDRGYNADFRRFEEVRAQLSGAVARGDSEPMGSVCKGYWGRSDEKRAPSPVLGKRR